MTDRELLGLASNEPVAWVLALPDGRLDRLSLVAYDDEAEEMLQRSIAGCTLVPLYTTPLQRHLPDWISYDKTTDVLSIHGKKYASAIFGEEGFLSPTGTVLRVEQSQPETVTLTVVPQRKPLTDGEIKRLVSNDMVQFARAIERAHGIGGNDE